MPTRPDETGPADERALMPRPRHVRRHGGMLRLARSGRVVVQLDAANAGDDALHAVRGALARGGVRVAVAALRDVPATSVHVVQMALRSGPVRGGHQGYRLRIRPAGLEAIAASPAGFRHAGATAAQLLAAGAASLCCLDIEDWPDFAARGVMLDISRDKVPTMATLLRLVDRLAAWKINELQLYTEHTFAYRGHEAVWRGASPMTPGQIQSLDACCRERGIELVPNQNSLGHMERWLKHARYRGLAECDGPWTLPWGEVRNQPTTLCPLDAGSVALVEDLYAQLLPHFSSRQLNVGCDEPWELGQGRSAAAFRRRGEGRVYLDWLLKVRRLAARHGRRIQFWSDWLLKHPELIARLPRDVTPMVWGYEADHPFEKECRYPRDAGLQFHVCPGTSSWCSFGGRTDNALANLRNAARAGLTHGASGYLITDWGDYGHRQYLPVSFAPFVHGAGCAWCAATNAGMDVAAESARHAYGGASLASAAVWLMLGRVSPDRGELKNQSMLFRVMHRPLCDEAALKGLTPRSLERVESLLYGVEMIAAGASYPTDDAATIRAELAQTVRVLRHAARRALYALDVRGRRRSAVTPSWLARDMRGIIEEHRRLWRLRNRPGGLASSVSYFEMNLREYERAAR